MATAAVAPQQSQELNAKLSGVDKKSEYNQRPIHAPGSAAKGGLHHQTKTLDPQKTAFVFIEFQNEFCSPGGTVYEACREVIDQNKTLEKGAELLNLARSKKSLVMHTPVLMKEDYSDSANPRLGQLKAVADGKAFREGTWGAEFCTAMLPAGDDIVLHRKTTLDAFKSTLLQEELEKAGIENIVLSGFLANCCVESTARTAYDKGMNVIVVHDATGATSPAIYKTTVENNYPMFCDPMTLEEFKQIY